MKSLINVKRKQRIGRALTRRNTAKVKARPQQAGKKAKAIKKK